MNRAFDSARESPFWVSELCLPCNPFPSGLRGTRSSESTNEARFCTPCKVTREVENSKLEGRGGQTGKSQCSVEALYKDGLIPEFSCQKSKKYKKYRKTNHILFREVQKVQKVQENKT